MKAEYLKEYYLKNKDHLNAQTIKRRQENREKYLAYQYEYRKARSKKDPKFKLLSNMRKKICKILKSKNKSTIELIGCSPGELKKYLESKFKPGMTWENYGVKGWHVDHRIPLVSAKTRAELEKLCHYTNLQPLWARENLSKNGKMPFEVILTE